MGFGRRNSAGKCRTGNRLQYLAKEHCLMLTSKRAVFALTIFVFVFGACISASAVERKLAGIKLSSPAETILKKYGNPTRVTVGTFTSGGVNPNAGAPQGMPGTQQQPGMFGQTLGAMNQMGQTYQGYLNDAMGAGGNTGGALPGLQGLPAPGMSPGMPVPGMPEPGVQQPTQPVIVEQQVTWTYDLKDGTTLEFIISESGRVIQITVGGDQPFALSKTTKGIKLGDYYKDVIYQYGYPERQQTAGRFLIADYRDKHRCLFVFLGKKLVGITIAFKSDDEQ